MALRPDYADAANNLGNAWDRRGQFQKAVECYRLALAVNPGYAEAYNNLGITLDRKGETDAAIACFENALTLKPDYAEAYRNLGITFFGKNRLDEATDCYQRTLEMRPDDAASLGNLGNVLKDQGRIDEALDCYQQAMALAPDNSVIHSNLLLALHYSPHSTPETYITEHVRWDQQHGKPLQRFWRPHPNNRRLHRRLKIGYVSPDLRDHPVGHFLLPLLAHHDHDKFEITCYADAARPDAVTERLRAHTDHWQQTTDLSEEQLAEQIRSDGIDILVDLALHTAGNKLPVFARKPAPVQVSFAGYPGATGLEAIDYRLSDPFLDSPGQYIYSSEQVIRLPDSFWLFAPPEDGPEVTALPASKEGNVTFGSLGNFAKVNPRVLDLWARALKAVPSSRLLLLVGEGSHRERTREILHGLGIIRERVEYVSRCPRLKYFELYQQVDIVLDTFPYNGHTTSLDALWMGVPVVSLAGQTGVSRGGLSILSNAGLPELVAHTEDEYVRIAVELAKDLPRLAQLREGMRQRMQASPLMDAPRFARSVEEAYREMWHNWCEMRKGGSVSES